MGLFKQACYVGLFAFIFPSLAFLFWPVEVDWDHFSAEDKGWTELQSSVQQRFLSVNDIQLLVNEAGPSGNPKGLVLLLHGFPETGITTWKYQIPFLAKQGYKVIAPDQRGYNTSWKSLDPNTCNFVLASADAAEIIKQSGYKKAFVVAHDWGAIVGFDLATNYPELVERLVILSIPHPKVYSRALLEVPSQLLKMWYIATFQVAGISEWKLRKDEFAWFIRHGFGSSNKGAYSQADIERLIKAWNQPNAIEAMVGWYRYLVRNIHTVAERFTEPIEVPTKIIFGDRDLYTDPTLGKLSIDSSFCKNCSFLMLPGSHWIAHDQPDRINQELLSFFNQ